MKRRTRDVGMKPEEGSEVESGDSKPTPIGDTLNSVFGSRPYECVRSPGRINLIGDHTDYNQGFVLPMAIAQTTDVYFARRLDPVITVRSAQMNEGVVLPVEELKPDARAPDWALYGLGPIWALQRMGYSIGRSAEVGNEGGAERGLDVVIDSRVPMGAGLSSSAALQTAVTGAVDRAFRLGLDKWSLVRAAQLSENEFVGVPCGIMDPFASVFGVAGHALYLDCRSMEFEAVPIDLPDHEFIMINTGVKHALGESAYAARQRECLQAAAALGVGSLRDVNEDAIEHVSAPLLPRARHVISENLRVELAAGAIRRGDVDSFGELMLASHESLKEDYEVSCAELDLIVDLARELPGCVGARLTGAGFGGCVILLVERSRSVAVMEEIRKEFRRVYRRTPDCMPVNPGAGLRLEMPTPVPA